METESVLILYDLWRIGAQGEVHGLWIPLISIGYGSIGFADADGDIKCGEEVFHVALSILSMLVRNSHGIAFSQARLFAIG